MLLTVTQPKAVSPGFMLVPTTLLSIASRAVWLGSVSLRMTVPAVNVLPVLAAVLVK